VCLITVFLSLLVFLAAGCATSAKKQTTDTRSAAYEKTQKTYQSSAPIFDYADEGSQASGSYGPPAEKTASGLNTQLSTKQVQRALKNSGFYKGEIDGKIGPKTKEAIIKFQKAHGLNGDGMVGKKTSSELRNYLSK
jgi:peptidoglycan hydrolase-like protein with peptidoglycan-binding domain